MRRWDSLAHGSVVLLLVFVFGVVGLGLGAGEASAKAEIEIYNGYSEGDPGDGVESDGSAGNSGAYAPHADETSLTPVYELPVFFWLTGSNISLLVDRAGVFWIYENIDLGHFQGEDR